MLACNHDREPFGSPICVHLRTCREPWIEYVKWYTGSAVNVELLCVPCAERREQQLSVEVESICEDCFEYATEEMWNFEKSGGKPEIRSRAEALNPTVKETALPKELGTIVDLAAVNASRESLWILLADGGQIFRFDCETGAFAQVAFSNVPREPESKPWCGRILKRRLHASNRGEFVAAVNDYGRYGEIIDLRNGEVTLALDGGSYHPETVPFSFAFVELNERVVAIHRTEWNRLDISDPASGTLLSERPSPVFASVEAGRPAHYLDYFHGGLCVSPGSTRIVDDGWVWHPVGIPTAWSVERWLADNEWESEDGPTRVNLCTRQYYWDHAMTWLDDSRVVIAGIGEDDRDIFEGARIFDVTVRGKPGPQGRSDWPWAHEITSFAGPAGIFFSDGVSLFSSDASGMSRWDPIDGVRTGQLKDFQPTHHHRGAGELVQLQEGLLRRWSTLEQDP